MKKALTIVAALAAYSLLETLFLLSFMLPTYLYPGPSPYQLAVFWSQFLLIPGMAILFSRLIFGPYRLGRRALAIVGVAVIGPFALLVVVLSVVGVLWWAVTVHIAFFIVLFLLIGGAITFGLRVLIRKTGRWSVELEANRWLAERQSGIDPGQRRWRGRGIRLASAVPCLTVLLVFLFLPEAWGLLSHLRHPVKRTIGGYRVPIPVTWILLHQDIQSTNQDLWISGLAGEGMARNVGAYTDAHVPLSGWYISIDRYQQTAERRDRRWLPKDDEVIARRLFTVGDETVTCLEYWPSYLFRPEHVETSTKAFVQCSGSRRFHASLVGERAELPVFYKMLQTTTRTD